MDIKSIESLERATSHSNFGTGRNGIVVTAFPEATEAGVEMLEMGGNAVDAACAAAFALGVCEPQSSGLGGQSMGMIHINGKTIALDGSSRLPSLATLSSVDRHSETGYTRATVPSTPAFLGYMHLRYGRLEWDHILRPAIRLAKKGYAISPLQHRLQKRFLDEFLEQPGLSGARYFLKNNKPYDVGDIFVQPDLGELLELLAEQGPRAFYLGEVARRISEDMRQHGGLIREEDLALIPWPIERAPVSRPYRGLKVCSMPPPASGRTLLLVLLMLGHLEPDYFQTMSPDRARVLVEIFRKALLQQQMQPCAPDFYPQLDHCSMTSETLAKSLVSSIAMEGQAMPQVFPPPHGRDTTHFSIMDGEGNAVGISQSIESLYGAKVVSEGLGFLYNNYANTMETMDPAHPHYFRPNALPQSSVAPTILFRDNQPWMVVGSPGSDRIFSSIAQFLLNLVDGRLTLPEAVERPRLHCTLGGFVSLEADRFDPEVVSHLERLGYPVTRHSSYSFHHGAIYAAMRCQSRPGFQGCHEIRREGSVGGV